MLQSLKVTFLGTGTSQGVPVIGCHCKVCISNDVRDKRLRTSVLVETGKVKIVIDTGPDFRQQMLTHRVDNITAVLFTHEHKDHVAGLDDIRPYNYIHKKAIDVYAEERVQEALGREYAYIFSQNPYPGVPKINMHLIGDESFHVAGLEIIPIRGYHHRLPVLGFRIGKLGYLTDIKTLPDSEILKLAGLEVFVINALQKEEHTTHLNLSEALALIKRVNPRKAFLTHLSHRFGLHADEEPLLPPEIFIAYDNLSVLLR